MRIGVVGAGAIGGWIGISLAAGGRHELSVLARGATLAALRAGPWKLISGGKILEAEAKVSDVAGELGEQDLVIIALKGPSLASAASAIAPLIGKNTIVVPTMNGLPWWFLLGGGGELPSTRLDSVDPTGSIAAAIPFESVLGSVVHASASVSKAGLVTHRAGNRIILRQFDLIPTFQTVHGADVHAVRAEDFHMFLDRRRCDHVSPPLLRVITRNNGRWFLENRPGSRQFKQPALPKFAPSCACPCEMTSNRISRSAHAHGRHRARSRP